MAALSRRRGADRVAENASGRLMELHLLCHVVWLWRGLPGVSFRWMSIEMRG